MSWNLDNIALTLAIGALHGDPDPFAVIVPMRGLQSNNDDIYPAHLSLGLSVDGKCGHLNLEAK